jgi:hypothetical protein
MEAHLDTSKTLALVGKHSNIYIYNNYGLMKIRANFENIKVQYFEMFKVFKMRFSNMSSLNNKFNILSHSKSF